MSPQEFMEKWGAVVTAHLGDKAREELAGDLGAVYSYGQHLADPNAGVWKNRLVRFQKMAKSMAAFIVEHSSTDETFDRASRADGDCVCEMCGLTYRDHPEVRPTFHILCEGKMVKT